jgi:hypothetical protein
MFPNMTLLLYTSKLMIIGILLVYHQQQQQQHHDFHRVVRMLVLVPLAKQFFQPSHEILGQRWLVITTFAERMLVGQWLITPQHYLVLLLVADVGAYK